MNNCFRRFGILLSLLAPCNLHGLISPSAPRLARSQSSSSSFSLQTATHAVVGDGGDDVGDLPIIQREKQSSSTTNKLRVTKTLGIDYGLVRTGLAMSGGYAAAQPVAIIDGPDYVDQIIDIVRLYQVEQMVLGWPLEKNGTVSEQAVLTKEFGMRLKETVCRKLGNVPLYLCDERYTSKAALATLGNGNDGRLANGIGNDGLPLVDAISACMILDSFFGGDELVCELTLPDDILRDCLQEYEQTKGMEEAARRADMENRDLQRQRRREAIEYDKKLRAEAPTLAQQQQQPKTKKKRKR
jgi:putative holliday junction resolvase